jgi:hypothetical protein
VIAVNGHIPRTGDVVELPPLQFTVVEANDYRVDLVRVVKTVRQRRRRVIRLAGRLRRPVIYPHRLDLTLASHAESLHRHRPA